WRIISQYIDMYISWSSLGNPSSYGLFWATDQENPNLNQAPTTDTRDEEIPIVVRDVVALSQSVNATEVVQGDIVNITIVVSNRGMRSESFDVTCYFYPTIIGTQRVEDLPIGCNKTLKFLWDTSTVEPGTYEIKAFVDSAGEILEIDEGNNWCTAEARVTVKEVEVHDVAALSQSVNATTVTKGKIVEISVVVKNLGDFTETFDVTCYYDDTPIGGLQTVGNLGPGGEETLTFYWDTSTVEPGVYFIKAFADSSRAITEYDEENNNCTAITPVTVVAPPGILDVDKALSRVVSGPSPAVVGRETVYEILIVVSNVGGSEITNVNVTDTIEEGEISGVGSPSQGSIRSWNSMGIDWDVGNLDVGRSASLTFTIRFTPSSSGVHTLNYGEGLYAEGISSGQEISDTGDLDVTVDAVIRDVTAVSQTPLKGTVVQGELVGIDVVVKNLGDYYDETFDVTCYYDDTPIQPIGVIRVYDLKPDGEETIRFIWDTKGVPPGIYCIKAFADSGREIDESYENNNCTSTACIEIVIHDIVAVSQIPDPTEVVQGEIVTIYVTVRNDGTEMEMFEIRCYYYGELECCKSINVINLAPSESRMLTFVWDTAGIPPGVYYIEARAIPVEGELDTDDNTCMSLASVTIKAPPVGGVVVIQPRLQILAAVIAAIAAVVMMGTITFKKFKARVSRHLIVKPYLR
ncbi:MAG: CARDB domain-containing protein, partial [Candidatus Bathyarchaeia archaeon]